MWSSIPYFLYSALLLFELAVGYFTLSLASGQLGHPASTILHSGVMDCCLSSSSFYKSV